MDLCYWIVLYSFEMLGGFCVRNLHGSSKSTNPMAAHCRIVASLSYRGDPGLGAFGLGASGLGASGIGARILFKNIVAAVCNNSTEGKHRQNDHNLQLILNQNATKMIDSIRRKRQ